MKGFFALLFIHLFFAGHSQTLQKTTTLKANSDFIRVTGRVKNNTDSMAMYWSGTSIVIRFKGTALKAKLKDEFGKNYFNIVVDGDSLHHIKLSTVKQFYTLATGLANGEHTVELIKRNEIGKGSTWFYEMEVEGKPLDLPPKNKKIIEFYGNSITAGYAIENYTAGDSPDSIYTNNYYTYAALTARHYKADLYCTVKSGIGVMVSWSPLIMPELYDRLDPGDSLSKWDFKKVTPDIIVVNLFQNDAWLTAKPDHPSFKKRFGNRPPDEKTIIASYKKFIEKIRNVYPKATIICVLGCMDATRKGSPWPGYITQAVTQLHDKKIYTHFFPYTSKNGHPRKEDNAKMAASLIEFIDHNIWK
jgi:hypothetical protein